MPLSIQAYKYNAGVTLQWTSISSKGTKNTPRRFMPQKLG